MKRPLRKFAVEYEMRDDDVARLCHCLSITVQAARGLLVNQDREDVRALIKLRGAHLSKAQRADLFARITHTHILPGNASDKPMRNLDSGSVIT